MTFNVGYLLVGALFLLVAVIGSFVKRQPFTQTMIYLAAGIAIGPLGFGLFTLDSQGHSVLLERLAEVAVIVSLFTTGLKLRIPLRDGRWMVPIRLAFGSMTLTVGLVAVVGVMGLGLPWGAAILLGAVLAPTDPVLASDVQLENPQDRNRIRFTLSGEAGLNDGTAFPFVMLGLGLLGLHDLGAWAWHWWAVDVLWAIAGGLGIGALCGATIGKLVIYLRKEHHEGTGLDEFLAFGIIAFSYGAALLMHTYGFLAVLAAGLALRAVERSQTGEKPLDGALDSASADKKDEIATAPETAPAHMASAVLNFNEQIERILEVALVLVVGLVLTPSYLRPDEAWFIALLFLVLRPIAVIVGLFGSKRISAERGLICWFGIRGIGSIYYLMYAINHGLSADLASRLTAITFMTVAVSIIVHGISVTPLMNRYHRRRDDAATNA